MTEETSASLMKKGWKLFKPLIFNVIGNLALYVYTFVNHTFSIHYFTITTVQLVVLGLFCLVNFFINLERFGMYFLAIVIIGFMWVSDMLKYLS